VLNVFGLSVAIYHTGNVIKSIPEARPHINPWYKKVSGHWTVLGNVSANRNIHNAIPISILDKPLMTSIKRRLNRTQTG